MVHISELQGVTDCQNAAHSAQQGLLRARNISLDGWNCYFII